MSTEEHPDFWAIYWETEKFLSTLPTINNTLDIYDKIYRDQEEEKLAEFYSYKDADIDDLNNLDLLDNYDFYNDYENDNESITNCGADGAEDTDYSYTTDEDDFEKV